MDHNHISKLVEDSVDGKVKIDLHELKSCADELRQVRVSYGYTPLTYASLYGNTAAIRAFHDAGLDLNELDDNGYSPLCLASQRGKIDVVRYLLKMGANPDVICTNHKHTALMEALLWDNQHIASLLIDSGANVNIAGRSGLTPLHVASARNLQGATEAILRKDGNPNIRDNDGKLAIDYAKEKEHREVVAIYRRYGHLESDIDNSENHTEGDASTAMAKLRIMELAEPIKFARMNNIGPLLDDLAIQLATEVQKIVKRSFKYKHDATLRDAVDFRQMNCQSAATAYLGMFDDLGLRTQAVISPGHVALTYKLSNGSLLVMDDVISQTANYKIVPLDDMHIIYSEFMPNQKWGVIGDAESILIASYFQMMALNYKRTGKYDLAVMAFEKAIGHLPDYPELHYGHAIALKFAGQKEKSDLEADKAKKLRDKIEQAMQR